MQNRISRPQNPNEVNMTSLLENFYPGSCVQIDFAERGNDYFVVLCCQMSGFMQVYKTRNKSTEEALLKLREWSTNFGFLMTLVAVHIIHHHSQGSNARWAV